MSHCLLSPSFSSSDAAAADADADADADVSGSKRLPGTKRATGTCWTTCEFSQQ